MSVFAEALLHCEASADAWRELFAATRHRTAMGPLQVDLCSVDDDHLRLQMPITDAARQPYGLLHGGVSLLLAETAASFHACWGIDLRVRYPVGIEVSGSHVRSARDGWVDAEARILHRSRTLVHHEVRITAREEGQLLSVARVTNLYRTHAAPSPT